MEGDQSLTEEDRQILETLKKSVEKAKQRIAELQKTLESYISETEEKMGRISVIERGVRNGCKKEKNIEEFVFRKDQNRYR
jgi:ferritin-like metal-binding protein YciE